MAANQNERSELWLEVQEREHPPSPAPAKPGSTQAFVTRFELKTEGGLAVFDSERLDNTASHRRVRAECIKYSAPIPERTASALARYYEREAKRDEARWAAGVVRRIDDGRQATIPATDQEPVVLRPHPIVRSIESVNWTSEPANGRDDVRWLNKPADLPPKQGRHSDQKEAVIAILLDPDAPARMRFAELCIDLGARTKSKKTALRKTVKRLEVDGRVRITYGREGRSTTMLVELVAESVNRNGCPQS